MENLQFLKDNIKYSGFGEALYGELEKNIQSKKNDFQLHFATQVNNRPFDAILHFRKSNTSEMYIFNRYVASVEKANGEKLEQSFSIDKGKGVTAKEAYNLLQGRAVYKELTNSKGGDYRAWMQLDFDKKDEKGNYAVNKYTDNYGYDLRESVAKFPVLELDGGEKEKELLRSLERGNAQAVSIDKDGEPLKVFLEANPKYKSVNVYDEHFKMMKHENLPKIERLTEKQSAHENTQMNGQAQKQTGEKAIHGKNVKQGRAKKTDKGKAIEM